MSADIRKTPPPNDVEAERSVLGAMFAPDETAAARRVTEILIPSDFWNQPNRVVFESVVGVLMEKGVVDPLLVLSSLERRRELDNVGGRAYLSQLVQGGCLPGVVEHHAGLVREKAVKRALLFAAEEIAASAQNGHSADDVAARAKSLFDGITRDSVKGPKRVKWKKPSDLASSHSDVEWLWRGYLGRGLFTLLASEPKAGKTTAILAALAASQRGDETFLGQRIHKMRVLYVSEDPPASLHKVMDRFGITDDGFLVRDRTDLYPRVRLVDLCAAAAEEARIEQYDLVVVDTMSAHAGLVEDQENSSGAVEAALQHLVMLAGSGPAVMLVHHLGRSGTIRGSGAFEGRADIIVEFKRFGQSEEGPRSTQRVISARGKFEETPDEIVADLRGSDYVLVGDANAARLKQTIDRVVAFVVASARWVTAGEVYEGAGGRKQSVLAALKMASAPGGALATKAEGAARLYAPAGLAA